MCVDVECYVLFGFDFRSHSLMMLSLSVQALIVPSLLPVCVGCQHASTPLDVRAIMDPGDAELRLGGLWPGNAPDFICRQGRNRSPVGEAFATVFQEWLNEPESDTGSAEDSGYAEEIMDEVLERKSISSTILDFIGHPRGWSREEHFGFSGPDCGCCVAANLEDWFDGCDICLDLWYLSIVDTRFRLFVSRQALQATGSAAEDDSRFKSYYQPDWVSCQYVGNRLCRGRRQQESGSGMVCPLCGRSGSAAEDWVSCAVCC